MFASFINYLIKKPVLLDFSRRILEGNHRSEKKVIFKELPDRFSKKTLDLGCGTGVFSPFFGPDYIGIDISERYIKYACQKYNKNFLVADARALDFIDQSFDIIFVNGVLHHLDDKTVLEVMKEMNRVLRLNGRALIMENILSGTFSSKLIAKLDAGEYIRIPDDYRKLLTKHFKIANTYSVKMGICDYQVFILNKN